MNSFLRYSLCVLLLAHANSQKSDWKNRVQIQEIQDPNNYGSPEILPYISTKFSERATADDVEDKDKLLSLFTNTKREVKDAETFLSEMLRVLKNLFSKSKPHDPKNSKVQDDHSIAWSYYDDLGK
ncbi:uncharacterized protein LOC113508962 [Trichoplusia ni]|uniref:Uncharacterized protein LOC113508962 n=1 Tax=Trichoplusia ni TaxID=7111 RepID=A0A7E5X5Y9_TRINI|nr:uncharacterized protein LOC113508962 [Trichoplusia ni]